MNQGFNPFLPSWEYIPDGEPHVFGDRVYLYGSHDRFNGHAFCLNDYVCYSAPVTDLRDWRYEGVIYTRGEDPANVDGDQCLYAPDVCRGPDGRYYLYYVLDASPFVSVAVSDTPAGRYHFYGYVRDRRGGVLGKRVGDTAHFDPGVYCDGNRTYLYTGFCPDIFPEREGAMVTVLGRDMLTVEEEPRTIVPGQVCSAGTGFEGHAFYEASSIRKVGDTWYFIYSSQQGHELCYATSSSPVEGFVFRGTLISNVDLGIGSYKPADRKMAFVDNNHGSIERINGRWYVFYHRHTNSHSFSRQACLEPVTILEDGTIPQTEMTSCGPNGGPLAGEGTYPGYLACNLWCAAGEAESLDVPGMRRDPKYPYITQDGKDGDEEQGFISHMQNGAAAGFKYFDCAGSAVTAVTTRGWCGGHLAVMTSPDGPVLGTIDVTQSNDWKTHTGYVRLPDGVQALYFRYEGAGYVSLYDFTLHRCD